MSQSPLRDQFSDDLQLTETPEHIIEQAISIILNSNNDEKTAGGVSVAKLLLETLRKSPEESGRLWFSRLICKYGKDQAGLSRIAEHLYLEVFLPLKVLGGCNPMAIPSDFESLFPDGAEWGHQITSQSRQLLLLREKTLQRDGYKCCVTGVYDFRFVKNHNHTELRSRLPEIMELAHILPFGLNNAYGPDTYEARHAAIAWEILQNWAPSLKIGNLHCEGMSMERNAMTLRRAAHMEFVSFNICFHATAVKNRYRIESWDHAEIAIAGMEEFGFKNHEKHVTHDLPDPKFIAVHAALAQVLHLSGAAEVIDEILENEDEMTVLATDSSTDAFCLTTGHLSAPGLGSSKGFLEPNMNSWDSRL